MLCKLHIIKRYIFLIFFHLNNALDCDHILEKTLKISVSNQYVTRLFYLLQMFGSYTLRKSFAQMLKLHGLQMQDTGCQADANTNSYAYAYTPYTAGFRTVSSFNLIKTMYYQLKIKYIDEFTLKESHQVLSVEKVRLRNSLIFQY